VDAPASDLDPNLYFILVGTESLILIPYIDDFLKCTEELIVGCKVALDTEFEMKDIGLKHYFLGLELWHVSRENFLGQGKYVVEILKRSMMEDCRPMAKPMVTNLKKAITSDSE